MVTFLFPLSTPAVLCGQGAGPAAPFRIPDAGHSRCRGGFPDLLFRYKGQNENSKSVEIGKAVKMQ